jgi:hypothetical protein
MTNPVKKNQAAIAKVKLEEAKKKEKSERLREAAFKSWRVHSIAQGKANDSAKALNETESKRLQLEREILEAQRQFQELNQQKIDEEERIKREREESSTTD